MFKNEKGEIIILFLIFLIFFTQLASLFIDIFQYSYKKNHLVSVGNIVMNSYYDFSEEYWGKFKSPGKMNNNKNPQIDYSELRQFLLEIAKQNGVSSDNFEFNINLIGENKHRKDHKYHDQGEKQHNPQGVADIELILKGDIIYTNPLLSFRNKNKKIEVKFNNSDYGYNRGSGSQDEEVGN